MRRSARNREALKCATLAMLVMTACDGPPPANVAPSSSQAAPTEQVLLPVPMPVPLTFPVPIEVSNLDQHGAYTQTKLQLAYVSHFTILARDEITGDLGLATVSNVPAIGALLGETRAETGVAIVGALANTSWKEQALDLLASGKSALEVVEQLAPSLDPDNLNRQLAVLDNDGKSACYIGEGVHGGGTRTTFIQRPNCLVVTCQIAKNTSKLLDMADAFDNSLGFPLPERLILALRAGWNATPDGAEPDDSVQFRQAPKAHPAVSAAVKVVRKKGGYDHRTDTMLDLRVDLSNDPLPRLTEAYHAWCGAVLGQRLIAHLSSIDPEKEPEAYKLNQRWRDRARRRTPIGQDR